jgi:hypothetical protein
MYQLRHKTLDNHRAIPNFLIEHGLIRIDAAIELTSNGIDRFYYDELHEHRVEEFFTTQGRKAARHLVKKKVERLDIYKKELEVLGIEYKALNLQPEECTPEQLEMQWDFLKRSHNLPHSAPLSYHCKAFISQSRITSIIAGRSWHLK